MRIKKWLAGMMAVATALPVAVSAQASFYDGILPDPVSGTTVLTGRVQEPTINVTVPESGTIILNPYRIAIPMGEETVSEQVISDTQYIVNHSDVGISVGATVVGTTTGNVQLVPESTAQETEPANNAFLYLEMQAAVPEEEGVLEWTPYDASKNNQIIATQEETSKSRMLVLEAPADSQTGTWGAFRMLGDLSSLPKELWSADDGVNVTVTFTFTPVGNSLS